MLGFKTACKNYIKNQLYKESIIQKKEMVPLTDEENKSYKKQKVCYKCKKRFSTDDYKKSIIKSEIIFIT